MQNFGFPLETMVIFVIVIVFSLFADLYLHKNRHSTTLVDATLWSVFWIALALAFYAYLWLRFDPQWANLYLTGYVLEKSLSIDNLMVFMVIFAAFNIRGQLQRNILYWGILGALLLRALFVIIGIKLLDAAPWVGFIFAAFIVWTAIHMLLMADEDEEDKETEKDYSNHWSVKITKRFIPVYPHLYQRHLLISQKVVRRLKRFHPNTKFTKTAPLFVTPAFLCLIVIEVSDLAFAFDSVPAVIAVTKEPLLVYAAMIFAILGLRSLYFVLEALLKYLVYLEKTVVLLLFFIGVKMFLHSWNTVVFDTGIHLSANASLWTVLIVLSLGVLISLLFPKNEKSNQQESS